MDKESDERPRVQFSLRTALLLTPLAAGWLYLHVMLMPHAIAADIMLGGLFVFRLGFKLADGASENWRFAGCGLIFVANFILLFSLLVLGLCFIGSGGK